MITRRNNAVELDYRPTGTRTTKSISHCAKHLSILKADIRQRPFEMSPMRNCGCPKTFGLERNLAVPLPKLAVLVEPA
jgi:hypothetical protein